MRRGYLSLVVATVVLTAGSGLQAAESQSRVATDEAPVQAPYEDRVIDGEQPLDVYFGDEYVTDPSGWPRSARIEAVGSFNDQGTRKTQESGVIAHGQFATANYGSFSVDGAARAGGGGTLTVWQRGMPFANHWLANNVVGVSGGPLLDMLRSQQRFYLPAWTQAGVATEWRQDDTLQLVAGGGQAGNLGGVRVPVFERIGGSLFTAGAQWTPNANVRVGAQWAGGNGIAVGSATDLATTAVDAQTLVASGAWRDQGLAVQGNLAATAIAGAGTHLGGWLDGSIQQYGVQHRFGVFRNEPGLAWGNQALPSDMQGGYYRASYQDQRWAVDGGVDATWSVSGATADITFVTGSARYQWNRRLAYGGGLNGRIGGGNAASVFAYVDHQDRWLDGHAQIDVTQAPGVSDILGTYSQTWNVPVGYRLGTMLGVGHTSGYRYGTFGRILTGIFGGADLPANLQLDGTLNWSQGASGVGALALYANVALAWRFAPNWTLAANYYASNANSWITPVVTSPLEQPIRVASSQQERTAFLTLRYDFAAGSMQRPIGGVAGGGQGSVSGQVFLDANNNGRLDAGEQGVPNLTVVLDGRFSVRTDADGRFEFAAVAPGARTITILEDSLPLPWAIDNGGKVDVEVRVRDNTVVEIGARRQR